jgi:hypothetical protein
MVVHTAIAWQMIVSEKVAAAVSMPGSFRMMFRKIRR